MNTRRLCLAATACLLSLAARAADWAPQAAFVEGGLAARGADSGTVGLLWAWDWQRPFGNAQLTGFTEAYLSRWSGDGPGGRESVTQVGVLPLLRLRMDHGRSPWFLEGGIGVSMMDRLYRNDGKQFSTRFNFQDVFGVGRSFGADRRHEASLRLAHISNAQIRKPNPGETFVQLRYAVRF